LAGALRRVEPRRDGSGRVTLNRLVQPAAEHAMPDWIRRTALADILGTDFTALSDEALYRNLDRPHPQRARIEQALAARERTLFNLDDTIYLYDLTSTYFEGAAARTTRRPSAAIRAIIAPTANRS
jgi:hypothetical protein